MRAAVLLDDGVDAAEFIYPYYRLIEAGFEVDVVAVRTGEFSSKNKLILRADTTVEEALLKKYQVLVVPGGYAPDRLRRSEKVLELVVQVYEHGGRIAAICHGPQVLISAGIVTNKKITGFPSIKEDIINAGADYTGLAVESDERIVTATDIKALPEFMSTLLSGLEYE